MHRKVSLAYQYSLLIHDEFGIAHKEGNSGSYVPGNINASPEESMRFQPCGNAFDELVFLSRYRLSFRLQEFLQGVSVEENASPDLRMSTVPSIDQRVTTYRQKILTQLNQMPKICCSPWRADLPRICF